MSTSISIQIRSHLHTAAARRTAPQLYSTELNEEHRPTLRAVNTKQRGESFSRFLKMQLPERWRGVGRKEDACRQMSAFKARRGISNLREEADVQVEFVIIIIFNKTSHRRGFHNGYLMSNRARYGEEVGRRSQFHLRFMFRLLRSEYDFLFLETLYFWSDSEIKTVPVLLTCFPALPQAQLPSCLPSLPGPRRGLYLEPSCSSAERLGINIF